MHRTFLTLAILLSISAIHKFNPTQQSTKSNVSIIDRKNQTTTQITDGDTIRIQITLPQSATQNENITFSLGNPSFSVGSCTVTSGNTTSTTDSFPSFGWHWERDSTPQEMRTIQAIKENGELIGQSSAIRVLPRPVILVHGFIANWQTWKSYLGPNGFLTSIGLDGFAVGDGQVEGTLNTGSLDNPAERTNTIAQNAEILGKYISGVKQRTGAEVVDLLVHSMGGLIARYYIDRVMQERDVAQLIMLGSPLGGSDCAVLPAALGFFLPASIELRQSYMTNIFNQQVTHRHGIEFNNLGGTAISEPFKSPCTDVPNDTVVSFESVNAIAVQSSKVNIIHTDLPLSSDVFNHFVKPLLQKPADRFLLASDHAPVTRTESPLQFTRLYTGHVEAGGATEVTIDIDPNVNVAAFALYDPSRSVTTIVRGTSGNVIELDPQTNGFIRVDDPSSLFYLGYGFANPRPGPWKITVQATESTPSNGTDFAISVYFVGGATLVTRSSTLVPQRNEQVEFSANLSLNGQALEIKKAQAIIKNADGNVETLNFPSGQQVSTIWTPHNPGEYAVDILVTGVASDGSRIERIDFLSVEVQPSPSNFQITFNLILVIVMIVLVLLLILYAIFRGTGRLVRHING